MREGVATLHQVAPFLRGCGRTELGPNFSREPYFIYDYELIFVATGCGEYRVGACRHPLRPGDLLLVPPGVPTVSRTPPDSGMAFLNIHFDFSYVSDGERRPLHSTDAGADHHAAFSPAAPPLLELPTHLHVGDDDRVPLLFERVLREAHSGAPSAELVVRACLLELIAYLHRRATGWKEDASEAALPEPIQRALALMEANVAEKLTLTRIAAAAHLHPVHFSRVFRQAMGEPPLTFFTRMKIARAKALLRQPGSLVKEAAYAVGFLDPHHFARVFRRLEGVSPGAYARRMARPKDAFLPEPPR